MAKLKGETMQWPNKKERQYNGQVKKGNNKITELRTILQRESQNS